MLRFDVLLPVYINDDATAFNQALHSVVEQTRLPERVVIACDGPISTDVGAVIRDFVRSSPVPVTVVRTEKNQGLGQALANALAHCTSEYVARMDADDVSRPDRFRLQCEFLEANDQVDVLGGHIIEYDSSLSRREAVRAVPTFHQQIVRAMNFRNPFNHMTVMFKRSTVERAGNYVHCPYYEDYYLWLRMRSIGATFANLDSILADVRGGSEMITRRGGTKYARATSTFLRLARDGEHIPRTFAAIQIALRTASAMSSGTLRDGLYRRFLRK